MSLRTKLPIALASVLIASATVLPATATAAPADTPEQDVSVTEVKQSRACLFPILDICP